VLFANDPKSHEHAEDNDHDSRNLMKAMHIFFPQHLRAGHNEPIDDEITLERRADQQKQPRRDD